MSDADEKLSQSDHAAKLRTERQLRKDYHLTREKARKYMNDAASKRNLDVIGKANQANNAPPPPPLPTRTETKQELTQEGKNSTSAGDTQGPQGAGGGTGGPTTRFECMIGGRFATYDIPAKFVEYTDGL